MNVEAIRKSCKEADISQNELARRVGVSYANMSNIMNGKRDPRVETLKGMCRELNKKAEELW